MRNKITFKKIFLVIASIFILLFLLPYNANSQDSWKLLFQPRQRTVKTISTHDDTVYIGTGNGIFYSKDKGISWNDFGTNQLSKDTNGNSFINWIYIDEEEKRIYIATSSSAYWSNLDKPTWNKFFENTKTESKEINSITVDNELIYLATSDGLWKYDLENNSYTRFNEGLEPDALTGNYETYYTLANNDDLYLCASSGIYIFNKESSLWKKISNGIQELPDGRINARYLLIVDETLWAACGTGIYLSTDKGKNWENISDGISKNQDGFKETFYLFQFENKLFTATASGIYVFNNDKKEWTDFSDGIRTKEGNKNVYWLSSLDDKLYAATDEGLFEYRNSISKNKLVLKGKIETDFANLEEIEPSIIEVQKQALRFSSLPTTGDYKRYRLQARLRNLIPRVGLDLNTTGTNTDYYQFEKGLSTDISLSNKFDSNNTTRLQRDGRSFKQLSVLWNTNQFVYDDEIREILNQARLTANIKENLLDDVTRVYYQRRKLQLENTYSPPEGSKEKLTRRLEIAELTGQIDSRTGGWFSKEIEKRKQWQNPK